MTADINYRAFPYRFGQDRWLISLFAFALSALTGGALIAAGGGRGLGMGVAARG